MQKTDLLIRTKLRLPFTRPELVPRPRLQEQVVQGLCGPLTLITAPAGFGKTTLAAACVAGCGMPVAWLSLDKDDNQVGRFLNYLIASMQSADPRIGSEAAHLAAQQAPPEAVLTSLINNLDSHAGEIVLVLDDYHFISTQAVHSAAAFLIEHCPRTFHLVIASRSDPPLPLSRLRARGQTVELRAAELRFTEPEAAQFLNDVMGLRLDAGAVAVLAERTEGWIAGLQMAALSMRDRQDVIGFIEGFSGTNRYILDYLLEEVLASQAPEMQCFLLCTSILERLSAPVCDAVMDAVEHSHVPPFESSNEVLAYLDRANLFLLPLDDRRQWYRYHHLFADLLRARLDQTSPGLAPQLHARAAAWYEQYGSTFEAIHHASLASDYERIERIIEQNYLEMLNRGETAWIRFWMGKLNKELVYQRPWLCLYEAFSRSWFGQLEEANVLLTAAEERIRSAAPAPGTQSMLGYHAYVKSRVTAMQGDTRQAIELCLTAREKTPADSLGLQIEMGITLGYEYFLYGDFIQSGQVLGATIRSGQLAKAVNTPVAAYCVLARAHVYQGRLHEAYELFQQAAGLIHGAGGQYLGVTGLVEVGIAALLCEWDDAGAALARMLKGLETLPLWGKADDLCLAYITRSRIHLALGDRAEAASALEKAAQLVQTCGVFSEARCVVESTQVNMWLLEGNWPAVDRWAAPLEQRFRLNDPIQFENELTYLTLARVFLAQNRPDEAARLLSGLEEAARAGGRQGRLIEILILKALALQKLGESARALASLAKSLALAAPEGYIRVFLDEGQAVQALLAQWRSREQAQETGAAPLRDYAAHLLSKFDAGPHKAPATHEKTTPAAGLNQLEVPPSADAPVEPLSQREREVLQLIAMGMTNQEIARRLIVSPGTVKAHTASIYRKLDVANRTEAAARARRFGLLP